MHCQTVGQCQRHGRLAHATRSGQGQQATFESQFEQLPNQLVTAQHLSLGHRCCGERILPGRECRAGESGWLNTDRCAEAVTTAGYGDDVVEVFLIFQRSAQGHDLRAQVALFNHRPGPGQRQQFGLFEQLAGSCGKRYQ